MGRPLDSLAAAQADRIEVRSAWSWLTAPDRGDIPEHAIRKARASGQQLDLGDLTRTIEEGSCEAVTETAWRQHRERVEAQEAARLAREARREAAREALAAERERARLRHERMTSR